MRIRRSRSTFGRLARLLAIVSLFSMAFLTEWHEMHPDLPQTQVSASVNAEHGSKSAPDADHFAEHAALHAMALADAPYTPAALPYARESWTANAATKLISASTALELRPPRA